MSILIGFICLLLGWLLGMIMAYKGFIIGLENEGYKIVHHPDRKAGEGKYKVYNMKFFDTGRDFEDD